MARTFQRLAILIAITGTFIAYLSRMPNSDGIEQINRVRSLAAMLKLTHLLGLAAEFTGISDRISLVRYAGKLVRMAKDKTEDAGLQIEDTFIENIPVRIARPLKDKGDLPAIVYFHGGAFYMGSVDTHNRITSTLAREANVVVISVEYRLAPEYPFPAGLEDCYTVTKYVLEHGHSQKLRIDRTRVAVAGDSAGGNFAAVVAMRFATHPIGNHSPRLQILIYPVLQFFDIMLPSMLREHYQLFHYTVDHTLSVYFNQTITDAVYANKHTSVAQKKHYRQFVDWSLIPSKYRTVYKHPITDKIEGDPDLIERAKETLTPEASPLLVEDEQLAKLPLTYISSVGHDRLRDEAFIYAGRLKRVGVSVVHDHYEDVFHGSLGLSSGPVVLDIARTMTDDLVKYIKNNL